MGVIKNVFKGLFSKEKGHGETNIEELRVAFTARYHHFKLLLNANRKALEIMSEMEEALRGTEPFGMTFIRSRCTGVSTNVWQIIYNLNELAPGKYKVLYGRFKEIQREINPFLRPVIPIESGPLVVSLESVDRDLTDLVGGKMAKLGEIGSKIGFTIPDGFAVTSVAYRRFMEYNDLQTEINRLIQATETEDSTYLYEVSNSIQHLIMQSPIPPDIEKAIREHYSILEEKAGKNVKVAMRSSALGEDMPGSSFAGQYRSELNVSCENIFQAYKEILAGKYSPTAMNYRIDRGLRDESVAMCVGCLEMVDGVSGGVTYSSNPLGNLEKHIVVSSVWGLPKPVVDGSSTSDLYLVSREKPMNILRSIISEKDQKYVCYPDEGICRMDITGDIGRLPSLTEEQVVEVAGMALELEEYYGMPQDIEWAITEEGIITILQCRPLMQATIQERGISKDITISDSIPDLMKGGFTASPGAASGPVFIVKKDADILRFPEGAVLVTDQSLPRWAVLLNRASALVTAKGAITGHLANVAREYNVPAIFGLEGATERLINDQIITVDADGRSIYEGHIDSLLMKKSRPRNLMEGSPIFEALKNASQFIIPLNLLDPDSPEFKGENCKTFHDITRFCHEKVVIEMFKFGKDHHFPERSSKQLYIKVPMQWWVLNLDDGFNKEVEGKYVRIEDISSIPMLALWEGITAFPWEGPPPVDGKGFMSVMFQATSNPALVTGVRSRYGDRNYFIISRDYCSLSSRLGFHFSIVESVVSERVPENYISYQFKGGAADDARKAKRVAFIREILEDYGFRVEVTNDHLLAHFEGFEPEIMKERLKILGYLGIHTRQLDMIMSNDSSVSYYKNKIMNDIRILIGG
ncbi:MAG: pyruvate, water dikinase [Deltaproteobacteria bacterium]|nr:pyruvate, water dikinase [Deltaproteobacteria bacterium]